MSTNVEQKTELQKYQQPMNINDLARMSDAFMKSGMFPDIKSAAMAMVKIQAGLEVGIKPFAAMTGIHIIQGKPTIGAGIIASRIKASGKYDYKVVEMTDDNCSIDFYEGKDKLGNSSFSIAEAKKAGTKNLDKFPKNMLFARAISNGVKWYCPDVFDGPVYVPEEMVQVTEDVKHENVNQPPASEKTDTSITEPNKAVPISNPDDKPFVILGHWYRKMELCKTKADVLAVYNENKLTIDAEPELQKLLKETSTKLSNQ